MEMKNHLTYFKRWLPYILVFALAVAAVTFILTSRRPPSYQVIQTYMVNLVNRSATADYQYGSYYDLKGAELFTQHVMSMLRSPALIVEIYQTAKLPYTIDNLNRFTNQFRADQDSSQQFTVRFDRYTEAEAQAIADAMTIILTREVAAAQTDSNDASLFKVVALDPIISFQEVPVWFYTGLSFIAGALCAAVLVYLYRYLQS